MGLWIEDGEIRSQVIFSFPSGFRIHCANRGLTVGSRIELHNQFRSSRRGRSRSRCSELTSVPFACTYTVLWGGAYQRARWGIKYKIKCFTCIPYNTYTVFCIYTVYNIFYILYTVYILYIVYCIFYYCAFMNGYEYSVSDISNIINQKYQLIV